MLILLSPAKTLDYDTPVWTDVRTQPRLTDEATVLAERLKKKSAGQLRKLMSLSKDLAALNYERYQEWRYPFDESQARPALFAFKGDVYLGLGLHDHFEEEDVLYAQDHLRILSGLYGVLRPLDDMMPYRLEMGTKLKVGRPNNLYEYWGTKIAELLNEDLSEQQGKVVVNLASGEYWKAVDQKVLDAEVITPEFKDWKNGQFKVLSFFAKKARGMMAKYLVTQRIDSFDGLQNFEEEGYSFNPELSAPNRPVFTRKQ
ncbi:MAG: peroxide stress protein YaaA [Flavobacteriales bacterium]|nr:peroxide stress protein YaaA [Flavobacteriales bacterium]